MELQNEIKNLLAKLDNLNVMEDELKQLKETVFQQNIRLAERMQEESIDSLEVDGIKFAPAVEQQFSLTNGGKWDQNPLFFKWLRDNNLGSIIKMSESVHPGTRKKTLEEMKEDGKNLPDFIKVGFFTHLRYNKTAVKRRNDNG